MIKAQEAWLYAGAIPEYEPHNKDRLASASILWRLNALGLIQIIPGSKPADPGSSHATSPEE